MGLQKFKLKTANTVISKDNASLKSMGKEQIFELFSLDAGSGKKAAKKESSGQFFNGIKLDIIFQSMDDLTIVLSCPMQSYFIFKLTRALSAHGTNLLWLGFLS